MLTDEQILQKATLLLEKISENSLIKSEFTLNEITDAEKRVVLDVLRRIYENPSGELAFDALFGEKFRLVIPFPVKDKESQLGEWVHMLEQVLKVDVDWEKGMVSAEREWEEHHHSVDDTIQAMWGGGEGPKKLKKKFQIKIGKYFAKLDSLMKEYLQIRKKIGDHKYKDRPTKGPGAVGGKHLLQYTIGETEEALSDEELKRYNQILNQLELYAGNTSHGRLQSFAMDYTEQDLWKQKEQHRRDMQDKGDRDHGKPVRTRKPIVVPDTKFIDMGTYWLNNSKKIREDVPTLENDKYSIIISRHPIDVLRMSDFQQIYSCHSPPSRAGGTGEYYKCAGAEAQGHGAIAFVVDTDDLLSATNTGNLDSAEQELMEYDEIFKDQKREFGVGENLELEDPLGRTRLRQFRFFPNIDEDEETQIEIAVPEKATYGKPPVGLVDRVVRWARSEQEAVISAMPRLSSGKIDLDDFKMYGGSYEDTAGYGGRKELLSILTGINMDDFQGQVEQVTDTEDELEDWGGIDAATVQREVDDTAAKWNRDWREVNVKGIARDTGMEEEALLIGLDAVINFEWDIDEWTRLPNYENMVECIGELLDSGVYGSIANLDEQERAERAKDRGTYSRWDPKFNVTYSNSYLSLESYIGKMYTENSAIVKAIVRIDPSKLIGWGHEQALYNYGEEYSFERFCQVLNLIDGRVSDAIREGIEKYFKRQGFIAGGSYMNLIKKLEEGALSSYFWDVRWDQEPPEESYEAWAEVEYDFDPEQLGIEPRILFDIVDSDDFKAALKKQLQDPVIIEIDGHPPGHEENDLGYLFIRDSSAVDSGGDVRYSITFKVESDDGDKLTELFYELVTGDMDDEDKIEEAFLTALQLAAAKNGVKLGGPTPAPEKQRNFDDLKDLGEVWRKYL